jgi:hypothetical protein
VCSRLYYLGLCQYTFEQRRNRLPTHFSEHTLFVKRCMTVKVKGKGKGHPITGHEDPEGSRGIASSILSLTLTLDGVCGQRNASAALPPGERPGTHCVGEWVCPRAGLDGCGKSRPTGNRSPDLSARSESLYWLHCPGPRLMTLHVITGARYTVSSTLQNNDRATCLPRSADTCCLQVFYLLLFVLSTLIPLNVL